MVGVVVGVAVVVVVVVAVAVAVAVGGCAVKRPGMARASDGQCVRHADFTTVRQLRDDAEAIESKLPPTSTANLPKPNGGAGEAKEG